MTFFAPLPHSVKEEEGLAANAILRVRLASPQAAMESATSGTTGTSSERGGGVAFLDQEHFVGAAKRLLELSGLKSIYDVWFDSRVVYRVPKPLEETDNYQDALSKTLDALKRSKDSPKELGIWAHGMSGDFYLELRVRFWQRPAVGEPSVVLEVGGNPADLTDPTGEEEFELDDKLTSLESSKSEIEKENARIRSEFESKLEQIQGILKQVLSVKEITQEAKVDVGSIW